MVYYGSPYGLQLGAEVNNKMRKTPVIRKENHSRITNCQSQPDKKGGIEMKDLIYLVMIILMIISNFVRIVKNRDGFKWYSITTSFGLGFCGGKILFLVLYGK